MNNASDKASLQIQWTHNTGKIDAVDIYRLRGT